MKLSPFLPTLRGWLALAALAADVVIVPLVTPAHHGPQVSSLKGFIVVLLATATIVCCFSALQKMRIPDCMAAFVSGGFAIPIFYDFLRTAA
jgi:hypothetical protein